MSWTSDTTELVAGGWLTSAYAGHGIRGDQIPSSGTHGASRVYPLLSLPTDAGKEYRLANLVAITAGWTVVGYEDTSVTVTPPNGTVNGIGQWSFDLIENGVNLGTSVQSFTVGVVAGDTTVPTLAGSITVGVVSQTSIAFSWPAGADNTAVTSYEISKDGGATWTNTGSTALSASFTGLTPGTSYDLRVRARDAAGNVSTPALAASQSTAAATATYAGTVGDLSVVSSLDVLSGNYTDPGVESYQGTVGGLAVSATVGSVSGDYTPPWPDNCTAVEFLMVLPNGKPLANATVEIQLAEPSFNEDDSGILMPRPIYATTDGEGKVVVGLWPSPQIYYASATDTESEAGLSYRFLVPEVAVGTVLRLQDLVIEGVTEGLNFENAALVAILEAKSSVQSWRIAVQADKTAIDATAASVAETLEDVQATAAMVTSAVALAENAAAAVAAGIDSATASAASALASKNAAEAAADAAEDSAIAAAASAASVATDTGEAADSAAAAAASAASIVGAAAVTQDMIDEAEAARDAALAALDAFDDRYLGAKASAPTLDNDGNALVVGAMFFKTTATAGMQVWNGTSWDVVAPTGFVTSVAGKSGTVTLDKNDVGLSNVDNTADASKPVSTATQTALNTKVTGPASAVDDRLVVWDGTTGKLVKDSGKTVPVGVIVGTSDAQSLSNKTLVNGAHTGSILQNGSVRGAIQAVAALDLDCAAANYFTKTIAGNSAFTFSNVPTGVVYAMTLELTHTSGVVTWPASVRWPGNVAPTLVVGKTHLFVFVTDSDGATWRGAAQVNYEN